MGPNNDLVYELQIVAPRADVDAARAILDATPGPAEHSVIVAGLGRLRAVTAACDDEMDLALGIAVRAEHLADYPADIVLGTLRQMERSVKFFPTLSELVEAMDAAFAWRRKLHYALATAREPEPKAERGPPPTEAEIEAIYAKHGAERPTRVDRPALNLDKPPRLKSWEELKGAERVVDPDLIERWRREMEL
jgi:hypothetical protein